MSIVSIGGVAQGSLAGRDTERALIEELVADARSGQSRTLVLSGEAGIGKTALLDYAVSIATDARVLRCRGVEWESELPFSGLGELLGPLRHWIPELPEPQAKALSGVLALAPPTPGDRYAAYVATLSLLAHGDREEPLLAVVDDAHWLDGSSTEALTFVARRLQTEGIVLLIALRTGIPSPFTSIGLHELLVEGLESDTATQLLLRQHPGLEPPAVRAILEASNGNPLALRELPAYFDVIGMPSEVEPMPTSPVIEEAFLWRVRQLPEETQRALVVASAGISDARETILQALDRLQIAQDALDPAEEQELIAGDSGRIAFRHPLVCSAVYSGAAPKERRAAHMALAEAAGPDSLDQRAWHRATAAVTADEDVAAELEEAGRRARARNAHGPAGLSFERAARLTPEAESRSRRLYEAGISLTETDQVEQALGLLAKAAELTTDAELRADAQRLRGRLLVSRGAEGGGELLWREGLRIVERDPVRGTIMVAESIGAYLWSFDLGQAVEVAHEVERFGRSGAPLADLYADLAVGFAQAHAGDVAVGRRLALSALDRLEGPVEPQGAVYLAMLLTTVEEYDRARPILSRVVAEARTASALSTMSYALGALGILEERSGRWTAASAALEEAVELTALAGTVNDEAWVLVTLARLAACRGDDTACRAHAEQALGITRGLGLASHMFRTSAVLGLLELGAGRAEDAIGHLRRGVQVIHDRGSNDAHCQPYLTPDLIEAYVRAGEMAEAESLLRHYEAAVEQTQVAWAQALALRCRGLLADAAEIDGVFGRALRAHDEAHGVNPFEFARTQLCYGERLRRAKRRGEAERELEAALETFERLGAKSWAERAHSELELAGRRRSAARPDGFASLLTPQELRVALVVATGVTNREVAAQLFLSVKTIENHLSHVFEKLGIRSRAELARIVALDRG